MSSKKIVILLAMAVVGTATVALYHPSDWETRERGKRTAGNGMADPSHHASKRTTHLATDTGKSVGQASDSVSMVDFEAGDFERAWNKAITSGTTEATRVLNLSLVIGRMSKIAEPDLILTKIVGEFGPGRSRCQLIGTLFMSSDRTGELSAVFKKLEFPDEKAIACKGIAHNLGMLDSPRQIDLSKYAFLGERRDEMLQKSLEIYVTRFYSKSSEDLTAAVTAAFEVDLSDANKKDLIDRLTRIAPFDCWDQLVGNQLDLSSGGTKALFSQMFVRDATVAMERIAAVQGSEKYFSEAFQQWLENDASKPIEWLESHKNALSLTQNENAMQGIAEYSARQGDCNVAWQWVAQISDPQIREVAEGKVWAMERDIIRREVSENPQLAVQSMASGESSHQEYWIEEAVDTWIAKDSGKANEWYQENAKTLPASKTQYVAAAFAKQAVNQGDTATARQWAALIQDAKTKDRIIAQIAKSEAGK